MKGNPGNSFESIRIIIIIINTWITNLNNCDKPILGSGHYKIIITWYFIIYSEGKLDHMITLW